MPEAAVADQTTSTATTTTTTDSLGWRAGLPDDLKQNSDLTNYKTVGDFTKDALSWKGKVGELESRLADAIPRLPDDATDEDRNLYYDALGRPKQASEYEFDGEDKNAAEWTTFWKNQFHGLGLTKQQAKSLSGMWNQQMASMVKAHNDAIAKEHAEAEQKFKSEMGDKYDTNVELAKRMWLKHGDSEFDKAFADAPPHIRLQSIKFLLKMAALTGEDSSPTAGQSIHRGGTGMGFDYSKSPAPPKK